MSRGGTADRTVLARVFEVAWEGLASDLLEFRIGAMFYGISHVQSQLNGADGYARFAIWKTTPPDACLDAVTVRGIAEGDFSVLRVFESDKPTLWSAMPTLRGLGKMQTDSAPTGSGSLTPVGVTIPVFAHDTSLCGGFGLCACDSPAREFEATWHDNARQIITRVQDFDADFRATFARLTFALSERERSVLSHAAAGLTSDQIAYRMNLSRKTVEAYLVSARKKMRSNNTTEAAAKAIFFNLL